MKRILAIALTLIMVLAALTGCIVSKNPSGSEGEQNPSGKRLPIPFVYDKFYSLPQNDILCCIYSIAEVRMGWYTGFSNINKQRKDRQRSKEC